jgi:hypothetical protein
MLLGLGHTLMVLRLVFSLFGVVLIARPKFIFGYLSHVSELTPVIDGIQTPTAAVDPSQRLIAVGYVMVITLTMTYALT